MDVMGIIIQITIVVAIRKGMQYNLLYISKGAEVMGLPGSSLRKKRQKHIVSVQELTLKTMGMRFTHLYKIEQQAGSCSLSRYRERFTDGTARWELEKSISCTADCLVTLLNSCGVIGWNGFHGRHPKRVSDGVMFTFSATVNDSQIIHADGSANFPKGYHEFVRQLDALLFQ